MASNITNRPKLVNGLANEIFNAGDFAEASADDKYLKKTGGVLSGSLTVPSLISNGAITLPTSYPNFPTSGQLGCFHKSTQTTVMVTGTLNAQNNYCQLPVPAGSYFITYNVAYINNVAGTPGSRPNLSLSNLHVGIASSAAGGIQDETRTTNNGITITFGENGRHTLNGYGIYQHKETTNQIIYLNCFVGANNLCTITATITAIRLG